MAIIVGSLLNPHVEDKIWGKEIQYGTKVAKIISADQPLSIQYHPIKKELFIALEPTIVYKMNESEFLQLKYGMTTDEWNLFSAMGEIMNYMQKYELAIGQELFIDVGEPHCIYNGKVIELSTCDDVTIRIYDFGRKR